ncbi:hypothetical protein AXJ10_gp92 [Gordonia phage GordTnk2]|uniref:Uncharacterized protein n=1 Tax=Gordonia phage GordTnk2 TaxID=1622192 RepID=A0A0E3XAU3_9CAUD|nr:hypothetical protein AXJ10_gp92 [Gordonia phage GordTnk2]AKC02832.1 hypothetical protein GordTnk2_92 [Gordonia phage GordTnk2]
MLRDSMLNFFNAIWFTVSVLVSVAALAVLVITVLALVSAARDFHRQAMARVRALSAETSDRTR